MSYSTVLLKVKTLLSAATGVSDKVYDYLVVNIGDWGTFLSLFKPTGGSLVHGYVITRISLEEEAETSRTNKATHVFQIMGFYSHDNATTSDKTFQGILENVRTAFRNKPTLDDTVLLCSPVQIPTIELRMFGDVLVHFADMRLAVTEEVQWT